VSLVVVPLALNYLGAERYGVWLTLTSLVAFLKFADLGLGNGLMTALARARGEGDRQLAREYTSTTFFLLIATAVLMGLGFLIAYPRVDWPSMLNVASPLASKEVGPALSILVALLLLGVPMTVTDKAQWGAQEGYITGVWQALGSVLGLGALLLAFRLELGLPWLVLAIAGTRLLASLLNGVVMFGWLHRWLRPSVRRISRRATHEVAKLGALFFGLQVANIVMLASDNVIIARLLGVDEVPQFAVPFKLFYFIPTILGLVFMPLWPAYAEAIANRDSDWVRRTIRMTVLSSFTLSTLGAGILIAFGKPLIDLWVGPSVSPSSSLLWALGFQAVLISVTAVVGVLFNAAGVIRFQLVALISAAVVALALKAFMAQQMGVEGVAWATVVGYSIFILIPYGFATPRLLNRLSS
jgi:O-antigen/teichoic acid export membrane protein